MTSHYDLSDSEFLNQFNSCDLDPELFTHEAHLRLAWIIIHKLGQAAAQEEIQKLLKKFVASVGATDKYNKTVTVAALKIVYHFIRKSQSDNFKDFISEFPRLNDNFKDLIDSHYSFDIFNSPIAKNEYLKPDKKPFDTESSLY
jgi:hypothetical protein